MAALKGLVIGMGVLLVIGIAAFIAALFGKMKTSDGFGELSLTLPPGYHVVDMAPAGDRVVLRLQSAAGDQRLLVVDPARGRSLGTLELKAVP